jgi:hypothetical protein
MAQMSRAMIVPQNRIIIVQPKNPIVFQSNHII